jgi:hypothetical protein
MNTKLILASSIAALSSLAGLATTAHAGDFRINLNLGLPRLPVVVIADRHDAPVYGYARVDSCDDRSAPRGFWKEVSVRIWVPERWVATCDRRGREIRTLSPGYFTYRTDRVWVDYSHGYNSNYYARR